VNDESTEKLLSILIDIRDEIARVAEVLEQVSSEDETKAINTHEIEI